MGEGRGRRRRWTEEEKRQIVSQTRIPGVTVAQVARRYEVDRSLVFTWRRDPRLQSQESPETGASLVPVEVMGGAMSTGSGPLTVSSITMFTPEFITIIATVVGTGAGLAMLIMRSTARVDADRRALQTSMDSFRAAMDTFRAEMQRLGERQSRLEGMHEGHERSHGTAD